MYMRIYAQIYLYIIYDKYHLPSPYWYVRWYRLQKRLSLAVLSSTSVPLQRLWRVEMVPKTIDGRPWKTKGGKPYSISFFTENLLGRSHRDSHVPSQILLFQEKYKFWGAYVHLLAKANGFGDWSAKSSTTGRRRADPSNCSTFALDPWLCPWISNRAHGDMQHPMAQTPTSIPSLPQQLTGALAKRLRAWKGRNGYLVNNASTRTMKDNEIYELYHM